ncbi:mechanosensitive ion channel domain-containing protein [Neisseria sicca]|uniref:mechanosensitive ion channel domain-containing protein n=1 Tax=Neisseria sicca TaxID=490 RepID=UPI000D30F5D1|nr:mechanosensitive ion channel domain-containing protein [Neisseria sicca]
MDNILHELFARQTFTSSLVERNFGQVSGWIELVGVLMLMAAAFWLSNLLNNRYFFSEHGSFALLRHIGRRILWPVLMMIFGAVALFVCNLTEFRAVWLHLLILAARWMILIRVSVAVVHAALPQNRLTDWLERAVSMVLWVGFVLWLSGFDDKILEMLDGISFSVGSGKLSLLMILNGILWVGLLMIGTSWLARFIGERLEKSSLDNNLSMILSKIIKTVMMVLAVLIALPLVGIDLTVLSVFGGALGVGIGFGLQKVASNYISGFIILGDRSIRYISGFIILGDRSIRMNDRLTVNNFTGYVTKITSRFVVLRNANGTEALIPNETFVTSMVVNESYTSRELQQAFNIQVAYHSDLIKALDIIKSAAAAQPRVSKHPAPLAVVTNFGDNGIDLRVTYWVKDPENGFAALQSAIFLDIWRQFNEHDIEFPYPQREVRILNEEQSPSNIAMIKAGMQARSDTKSDPAMDSAGDD